jgi:large-conductance mechanosensitive channel
MNIKNDVTKKLVSYVDDIFNSTSSLIRSKFQALNENIISIIKFFFIGKGIIEIAVGIVVGFLIMQINNIFVEDLMAPFIYRYLDNNQEGKLEDYRVIINGVNMPVGKLIVDVLKVVLVGSIIFGVYNMDIKF